MATTIATLTQKTDGSLEGVFATIRVNAPIAIVPNGQKASDEAPDFRVINRRTGFEIGAGWNRIAAFRPRYYTSVELFTPASDARYLVDTSCQIPDRPNRRCPSGTLPSASCRLRVIGVGFAEAFRAAC